jgi:quercetin dioxygenase-like cupin family protein
MTRDAPRRSLEQILITHERRGAMSKTHTWRGSRTAVVVVAVLVGCVIGMGADHFAFAQQPGIKRTELLRTDAPGNPAYEAVMAVAEIPAGGSAGRHRHYGIELGYVLQGTIELEHEGQPLRILRAGQAFKNEPGVHNARNRGKEPVKILAVYVVEKGKPLADPVP